MDDAELSCYESIGTLRAYVRKPRLMESGAVIQFFVPSESADHDLALMLGRTAYHDCQLFVTLRIAQSPDGKDMRAKGAPEEKPYAELAVLLYRRGFFNAPAVKDAIGAPNPSGGAGQSQWGLALAAQLGFESMGFVPPAVLFDWAEQRGLESHLPREYREQEETE